MTVTLDNDVASAAAPTRRRRLWPFAVIGMLLLAVIGAGISGLVYIRTYQPLANGGGMGPEARSVKGITDGVMSDTRWIVIGPAGTSGAVSYVVENDGSHPIRLLGLGAEHNPGLTGLTWADLSADNPGGGYEPGLLSHARRFPVTLHSGESVFLQVYVTKPKCQSGELNSVDDVPVKWSAFGVHHVWDYTLNPTVNDFSTNSPIDLCPSNAAIAHVDNR